MAKDEAEIGALMEAFQTFIEKHDLTSEWLEYWATELMGYESYEAASKDIEPY